MSKQKPDASKEKLTDLPPAPVSETESSTVQGGLGNFEIQGLMSTFSPAETLRRQ